MSRNKLTLGYAVTLSCDYCKRGAPCRLKTFDRPVLSETMSLAGKQADPENEFGLDVHFTPLRAMRVLYYTYRRPVAPCLILE
jgi:hypothetical protein